MSEANASGSSVRSTQTAAEISRRDAVRYVTALLGGTALVGGNGLLTACVSGSGRLREPLTLDSFVAADVALLDEIAETILPETETPGAKAAGVGSFMALMVADTYDPDEQRAFRDGLQTVDDESAAMHGVGFLAATAEQRLALLQQLDREQVEYMRSRRTGRPVHFFRMMKELTLLGYFTSEIGCTQALRYVETPGRFDPCAPYLPGEKAWASHA